MSPAGSNTPRQRGPGAPVWLAVLLALSVLPGCTTADIDKIPANIGGLPEGMPERPAVAPAYPAVHDMPPARKAAVLDEDEQRRLEADLIATRNRAAKNQKGPSRNATAEPGKKPRKQKPAVAEETRSR